MRRSIVLIICAGVICAFQTGCAAGESFPEIKTAAETDLSLKYCGTEYSCHIDYLNKDTAVITFSSPQALSGMSFRRAGGDGMISLGSLLCKGTGIKALCNSAAFKVFDTYDSLTTGDAVNGEKLENGCFLFCDDLSSPTFILETDPEGIPKRVEIPN